MFNPIKTSSLIIVASALLTFTTSCEKEALPYNQDKTPAKITKVEILDVETKIATVVQNKGYYPVKKGRKYVITCYATDNEGIRSMQLSQVSVSISETCGSSFDLFGPVFQSYVSNNDNKVPTVAVLSKEFIVPSPKCAVQKAPLVFVAYNNSSGGEATFVVYLKMIAGTWGEPT